MPRLTKASPYVKPASLTIFDVVGTDPTFIGMTEVPYRPVSSIDSGNDITFKIPGTADECIKPSHTFFTFGARFTTADGKPITNMHKVGGINNLGHSLWRMIEVKLNNHTVSVTDHYPQVVNVMIATGYGSDAKKSH